MSFKIWNPDFEAKVRESFQKQTFMAFLGAKLDKVEAGTCEISLPYKPELCQQHGFFHAGAVATVMDSACGYAALTLMEPNSTVLSVEFKVNLLNPSIGDYMLAVGQVVKSGRQLKIAEGSVYGVKDGVKKLCVKGIVTLMEIRPQQ